MSIYMSYQEGLNLNPTVGSTRDESIATADLMDTLQTLGNYSKLVSAARAAGLEGTLRGPDYITILAPDDEALARDLGSDDPAGSESKDDLAGIVRRHLVRGYVKEVDLKAHDSVKPLEGDALAIERDGATVRVGGARITKADIPCTNGMIHLIEHTLA